MKQQFWLLVSFLLINISLGAQEESPKKEGNVKVYQDDTIKNLVGSARSTPASTTKPETSTTTGTSTANGGSKGTPSTSNGTIDSKKGNYRILVYSGNNQKVSKDEAMRKRNLVKSKFGTMSVDVQYYSPMWKVFAGRYPSKADAENALYSLKGAFPSFGGEMYVIKVAAK